MDSAAMLTSLAVLSARTEAAERNILKAARERFGACSDELRDLVPRVFLDQAAADEYMRLTEERARLDRVIKLAQDRLERAGQKEE